MVGGGFGLRLMVLILSAHMNVRHQIYLQFWSHEIPDVKGSETVNVFRKRVFFFHL